MIVLVDVVIDDRAGADRPETDSVAIVELRDVSEADGAAVTLSRQVAPVTGSASRWLATTELTYDQPVDPRSDLNVHVRVTASPDADLSAGDWITMQSVPADAAAGEQRVSAPVRRVG